MLSTGQGEKHKPVGGNGMMIAILIVTCVAYGVGWFGADLLLNKARTVDG